MCRESQMKTSCWRNKVTKYFSTKKNATKRKINLDNHNNNNKRRRQLNQPPKVLTVVVDGDDDRWCVCKKNEEILTTIVNNWSAIAREEWNEKNERRKEKNGFVNMHVLCKHLHTLRIDRVVRQFESRKRRHTIQHICRCECAWVCACECECGSLFICV